MSDLTISIFYDGKKMKQPPVTESFYEPRNPKAGHYYQCIEANFEELEMAWDDHYERRYGYWRPYIMDVIHSNKGGIKSVRKRDLSEFY